MQLHADETLAIGSLDVTLNAGMATLIAGSPVIIAEAIDFVEIPVVGGNSVTFTPEPTTMALMAVSVLAASACRRRRFAARGGQR